MVDWRRSVISGRPDRLLICRDHPLVITRWNSVLTNSCRQFSADKFTADKLGADKVGLST
jgi:hypothetical protein